MVSLQGGRAFRLSERGTRGVRVQRKLPLGEYCPAAKGALSPRSSTLAKPLFFARRDSAPPIHSGRPTIPLPDRWFRNASRLVRIRREVRTAAGPASLS